MYCAWNLEDTEFKGPLLIFNKQKLKLIKNCMLCTFNMELFYPTAYKLIKFIPIVSLEQEVYLYLFI